jgi:hypothetical protein
VRRNQRCQKRHDTEEGNDYRADDPEAVPQDDPELGCDKFLDSSEWHGLFVSRQQAS